MNESRTYKNFDCATVQFTIPAFAADVKRAWNCYGELLSGTDARREFNSYLQRVSAELSDVELIDFWKEVAKDGTRCMEYINAVHSVLRDRLLAALVSMDG